MYKIKLLIYSFTLGFLVLGCSKPEAVVLGDSNLSLTIKGLIDLGVGYTYQAWIFNDGIYTSLGTFNVDLNGNLSKTTFTSGAETIDFATFFIITIEIDDKDIGPAVSPSDQCILAGEFNGSIAVLTVDNKKALDADFTLYSGDYMMATPTDDDLTLNEFSGLWWGNALTNEPGLKLPPLPSGWSYEGWMETSGGALSTGKFNRMDSNDLAKAYSDVLRDSIPIPGEDFLQSAPAGQTFPLIVAGNSVFISVEPSPDNSTEPFGIIPLISKIPTTTKIHELYHLRNNADLTTPSGNAQRKTPSYDI